jgi:hypothetical protein
MECWGMGEIHMSATVTSMTEAELRELIGSVVEQKLAALLHDPEDELQLEKNLESRLVRQMPAVAQGERGEAFDNVMQRLGLD